MVVTLSLRIFSPFWYFFSHNSMNYVLFLIEKVFSVKKKRKKVKLIKCNLILFYFILLATSYDFLWFFCSMKPILGTLKMLSHDLQKNLFGLYEIIILAHVIDQC